jgi:DNA transposition AAA+ family ATPase
MPSKYTYAGWPFTKTRQSQEIINYLLAAKEEPKALLIISDTGLGKTASINQLLKLNQQYTYVVTVGDSFKLPQIVNALLKVMGKEVPYNRTDMTVHRKMQMIKDELKHLHSEGAKLMIVLDEAENLKPATLKMVKELYDYVIKYCSLVLIGTSYILESMLNLKQKNRMSVPQLYRRFKAGIRYITPLNKARDFAPFFEKLIPGSTDVQDLLLEYADNYGELHDYLHELLTYCHKHNKEPSAQLFSFVHKISLTVKK